MQLAFGEPGVIVFGSAGTTYWSTAGSRTGSPTGILHCWRDLCIIIAKASISWIFPFSRKFACCRLVRRACRKLVASFRLIPLCRIQNATENVTGNDFLAECSEGRSQDRISGCFAYYICLYGLFAFFVLLLWRTWVAEVLTAAGDLLFEIFGGGL